MAYEPTICEKCNHHGMCSEDMVYWAEDADHCDCFEPDGMITARQLLATLKVRPLGNTDLYVIDRAEFDALKEKYGKGKGE